MSKKVAVIGSGFGGLSSAVRLAAQGFQVTVFEKRDKPGGRAYVYQKDGFTFDAGPTVITAPPCLEEVFESAGRKLSDYVELLAVNPMYRLSWEDGTVFYYSSSLEETLKQIRKISPEDEEGYLKFLDYAEKVFEEGYTKLADVPFLDISSMVRVAPQLIKLKSYQSVYQAVSRFIKHPHLREAFSFHSLLVGGNPFSTSAIYTLIHALERKWGVYFVKGGTHALVRALVKVLEEWGGKIHYNASVLKIVTQDGRVTGVETDRGFEAFDAVVSNADIAQTYIKLLKETPEAKLARAYVKQAKYSMSLFVLYFGSKKKYSNISHHNVLFGPRYESLLEDIFEKGVLAEDFSLYLHAPCLTDPSLAPEGCEAFYVLSPVPHLGKAPIDWKKVGPIYAEKILEYLEAHALPGLRENIVNKHWFTPEDFKTELDAHYGSSFSLEPLLRQSAYFRIHNRDPRIQGLYFVGAGTHPGAGIPGVVNSAKATARLVSMDFQATTEKAKARLAKGSKSFSLASLFLPKSSRNDASFLYAWCRYVDDEVDQALNPKLALEAAEKLKIETTESLEGKPLSTDWSVAKLAYLSQQYQIPKEYFLRLIEGVASDVGEVRIQSQAQLRTYCHQVAGVVGLMMAHLLGVKNGRALDYAESMGTAMQLSNIARDIREDWERNRIYIPREWLIEAGLNESNFLNESSRPHLLGLMDRLLSQADSYYDEGRKGLKDLPWSTALAVAIASRVYQEIGHEVLRRGSQAVDERVVVSKSQKLRCVVRGFVDWVKTIPHRFTRHSNSPLKVWTYEH